MKEYRRMIAGLVLMIFLHAGNGQAELIWGEIISVGEKANVLVVRKYDEVTGSMRDVTLKVPDSLSPGNSKDMEALQVGDEILVEAVPDQEDPAWNIRKMAVSAPSAENGA